MKPELHKQNGRKKTCQGKTKPVRHATKKGGANNTTALNLNIIILSNRLIKTALRSDA